jgi:hypothetical protein
MREVNLREKNFQPNQQALLLFPEALARRLACFPVSLDNYSLTLVISEADWNGDKMNIKHRQISEAVGISSGIRLHFMLAPPKDILWAIDKFYSELPPAERPLDVRAQPQSTPGDDPLFNTTDEIGELPEGGTKTPHTLRLRFKSREQAERFIAAIAISLPEGFEPEKIEHE